MKQILLILIFAPLIGAAQNVINMNSKDFFKDSNSFLKKSSVIIDARDSISYSKGHLINAINIDAFKPEAEKFLSQFIDKKIWWFIVPII